MNALRAAAKVAYTEARDLSEYGLDDTPGVPWDVSQRVQALHGMVAALCTIYAQLPPVPGQDSAIRQEWLDIARDCLAIAVSESARLSHWPQAREELEEAARALAVFLEGA